MRGAIGVALCGLFVGVGLLSPHFATAGLGKYAVLGVLVLIGGFHVLILMRPTRIVVGSDFAFAPGVTPVCYRTPLANVRAVWFDGSMLRIALDDLAQLDPQGAGGAGPSAEALRQTAQKQYQQEGAHFSLPSFTLAQVEEVREAAGVPSPGPDEPAGRAEGFYRKLVAVTPRVWVTGVLVAINVAVFAVMVLAGVHPLDPSPETMLEWGANFGPSTTGGEWWRIVTATFLHIGFFHLLMNMLALAAVGPLVERLLGNAGFLVLYFVAGLCGCIASLYWDPLVVSAGASGAIFGVFGGLLAYLLLARQEVPMEALRKLRYGAVALIGYNLLFGFFTVGVDQAAHIGGLVSGFLCGLILTVPLRPELVTRRVVRTVTVGLLGFVVIWVAMLVVPKGGLGRSEYERVFVEFVDVEKQVIDRFQGHLERLQRNQMTEAEFADRVDQDVIPPWREIRNRFLHAGDAPARFRQKQPTMLKYLKARLDGWELLVRSIRMNDPELDRQAAEAFQEVERLLQQLK